jgi:hypothetical protein
VPAIRGCRLRSVIPRGTCNVVPPSTGRRMGDAEDVRIANLIPHQHQPGSGDVPPLLLPLLDIPHVLLGCHVIVPLRPLVEEEGERPGMDGERLDENGDWATNGPRGQRGGRDARSACQLPAPLRLQRRAGQKRPSAARRGATPRSSIIGVSPSTSFLALANRGFPLPLSDVGRLQAISFGNRLY